MKIKKIRDLGIVIPAHNEFKTIELVAKKTSLIADICVVNDNSKDGTQNILKKNNIQHINNFKRLGYEASIVRGIKYFLNKKKYILTFDADLQFKLSDIKKAYKIISNKKADIVIGSRDIKNRSTENILNFLFNVRFNITDPISGLKIYNANSVNKIINYANNNFFLVDIITNAIKKNLKIENFKVKTKKRADKPRVGNLIKSNFKILKILIYVFFFNINE